MIDRYSFIAASFFHFGSVGSLRKTIETDPSTTLFVPPSEASCMMFDADETAFVSDSFGFQPSLLA